MNTEISSTPFARIQVERVEQLLADAPEKPDTWLSVSELARLERLKAPNRADQFLSGHWLVRCLLGQQFAKPPAQWQLVERRSLPPAVLSLETVQVSISHSGDWIAAAISNGAIGIDLEQRRERAGLMRFQHLLLAQGEAPNSLDLDQLLQRWVAKEAWVKRHHGSALPEQLEKLVLLPSSPENASLQLIGTEKFYLAITAQAAPEDWQVDLSQNAILQRSYWRF